MEGPGAGLCSKGRFWSHSRFSRGPKMVPWDDLFRQKTELSFRPGALFGDLQPTCFRDPFRSAPGHHFGRLWMDLGCILLDFGIIFDRFRIHVCNKICRSPIGLLQTPDPPADPALSGEPILWERRLAKNPSLRPLIVHQNSDLVFVACRTPSAAPNAKLQIRGRRCSRR